MTTLGLQQSGPGSLSSEVTQDQGRAFPMGSFALLKEASVYSPETGDWLADTDLESFYVY